MTSHAGLFSVLERLGFDRPKFHIGLQISLVAFAALGLAWALGLEHPQWAAITTFVTLQPSRGQIIEKSSYRFIGTLAGSGFGALTVYLWGGNLGAELIAVTLWAMAMVFIGALQRAYRSYGTLLAGYSAIIVVVLSPFNAETVQQVATHRIAAVVVGLIAAVIWASLAHLHDPGAEARLKARRLLADMLQQSGRALRAGAQSDISALTRLITAAGLLQDELLSLTANGRYNGARRLEQILQTMSSLLLLSHQIGPQPELGLRLEYIAEALRGQNTISGVARALRKSLSLTDDLLLDEALTALMVQFESLEQPNSALQIHYPERARYALDWTGAGQSALRLGVVLGLISLGWWISGDSVFQYPLVSAAICMALATTGVTPARKMEDVLRGQITAACVAIATEMILWQLFPSPTGQLLSLLPAALIFAFIRSHRATSLAAPDYAIMVFLLLSPEYSSYQTSLNPLWRAVMAVSGAALGYLAFRLIFPTDARARRKALWRMIKRDLQAITQIENRLPQPVHWRQSFIARFLRIAHWAALEQGRYERAEVTMRKGLLSVQMAETVFMLRGLRQRAGLSNSLQRAIDAALERINFSSTDTPSLSRNLSLLGDKFQGHNMRAEALIIARTLRELQELARLRKAF